METVINFLKLSPIIAVALLTGCRSGILPDPNDPDPKQLVSGEILLRNIGEMMQTLEERVGQGEINAKQREKIVEREVGKMLKNVDVARVPPKQAWQFGDAFRLAGNWDTALKLYTVAVKAAKTDDRLVNDTLRVARAQAHLGLVTEAVASCRSTFKVGPREKAPILLAVLYEVVPEGVGKGKDLELARLLEDSIKQHKSTIVNVTGEGGKAFLRARPVHIHFAWIRIAQLYQGLNLEKEAREAIIKDEADRQKSGAF